MAEENRVPMWARELAVEIASTIEFKAQASLDCQQWSPEETEWGVDLVELWPAVMEFQEAPVEQALPDSYEAVLW